MLRHDVEVDLVGVMLVDVGEQSVHKTLPAARALGVTELLRHAAQQHIAMRLHDELVALPFRQRLEMGKHRTAESRVVDDAAVHDLVAEHVVKVAEHEVGEHYHRLTAAGTFGIAVHLVTVGEIYIVAAESQLLAGGEYLLLPFKHIHDLDFPVEMHVADVVALRSREYRFVAFSVQFVPRKHSVLRQKTAYSALQWQ